MSVLTSTTIVDLFNTTFDNNRTGTTTIQTLVTSTTSSWIQIPIIICMTLIDICAFFGNLLVICAFLRTRRLQTVTNYFIASLAFADALVAIFVLPLSIYYYQRERSWKLGLILCDLWVSSDVLLCTSSILNLTCISLDRYMAITRPLTYTAYRSKFLARVMILLVWIVSVAITCPPIFGWRDSNRRQTVEQEHRCELNTARGYVVYSALGSFYIPAVIMIFVYIRIFMVVYDRRNLINKFQDNNNNNANSSIELPLKSNRNGTTNAKIYSDGSDDNNHNQINKPKRAFCCCLCFHKTSQKPVSKLTQESSPLIFNCNTVSNFERKSNGCIVYRFTNPNPHNSSSAPTTPPTTIKTKTRCRPCLLSTNKMRNLSDEISHYRRNYISYIGAEYQFRTGDSPCFESRIFTTSLSSSFKCRSHSLEQSPTTSKRNSDIQQLNLSTKCHDEQPNDILLLDKENGQIANEHSKLMTQSLHEFPEDSIHQLINQKKKLVEKYPSYNPSTHSTTLSAKSSLSIDQNLTNSSTVSTNPEQTRINRRVKHSRVTKSTPSAILIAKFKQQYKVSHVHDHNNTNNHSSLKSNLSITSIRPCQENPVKNSRCLSYCCCCCCFLKPLNTWYENKNKQTSDDTPNQSLTNDDEEKHSSNETVNPTTIGLNLNNNLRTLSHSNQNTSLRSHNQYNSTALLSTPTNDVHRRERIRFIKEQKTAKTLAVVVGGFILFWLPFFIMYIIPSETFIFNAQTITLLTWLGYFNSVINPFIYAYCSKQFRMAFWNITFGTCIKKTNSSSPISLKNKQMHQRHLNI